MQFDYLHGRLDELQDNHRLRRLIPRRQSGIHIIEPDGRKLINFGSNDYLGLAAVRSAAPVQTGSQASALVCGWTDQHQQLADAIAELEATEAAVLFPSGFAACSGTVATLAEAGDLILSDELNHASLIDGCRLSRANCIVYPHRDHAHVAKILEARRGEFTRVWIVTDGVFSMDGHIAPLRELSDLAATYDGCLIVDEAHATGVLGEHGSGLCEALDVKDRVAIRIGTLSKAIGSQGGFVAAPQVVVDYLINRCRSLIYSTALAPAAVQAAINAFDTIKSEPKRRQSLAEMSRRVRQRLSIDCSELESPVPIIPVVIGDDAPTLGLSNELHAKGFFVPAIRPPTVPLGTARLRISLSAAHDQQSIESLLVALTTIRATTRTQ